MIITVTVKNGGTSQSISTNNAIDAEAFIMTARVSTDSNVDMSVYVDDITDVRQLVPMLTTWQMSRSPARNSD